MQIRFFLGTWGMRMPTLEAGLARIKQAGFDGVEINAAIDPEDRKRIRPLLDDLGLDLIMHVATTGQTPQDHARSLEALYCQAMPLAPRLVNAHTGKDYFTVAENIAILQHGALLEEKYGLPLLHETHRGRALYSLPAAEALLNAVPALKLTADLSHWCAVHDSFLQDQPERLERALRRTHHIHARVGYPNGPQVSDPRAPEWSQALETHLGWWQQILAYRQSQGAPVLTITPEFCPPDYLPTLPYTRQPVADLWAVNLFMRDYLQNKLQVSNSLTGST